MGSSQDATRHRLARRQAINLATQLPETEAEALLVLRYLAELIKWEECGRAPLEDQPSITTLKQVR